MKHSDNDSGNYYIAFYRFHNSLSNSRSREAKSDRKKFDLSPDSTASRYFMIPFFPLEETDNPNLKVSSCRNQSTLVKARLPSIGLYISMKSL